jgi:hypothetical protein
MLSVKSILSTSSSAFVVVEVAREDPLRVEAIDRGGRTRRRTAFGGAPPKVGVAQTAGVSPASLEKGNLVQASAAGG